MRAAGEGRSGGTLLIAALILISSLTVFPLIWMVSSAFKTGTEVYTLRIVPEVPTLDNFRYVFTQLPFARYMFNSFFVSATVTVVALFFHSMAAYALARLHFPGRELIFRLIFSTLLVSLPVILVPLFVLVRSMGMLNTYAGLIIPAIFNAFGIFLLRQFYLGIPQELEEAAILDGAGYWRVYANIILPLSRPILAALAVFFFLANWNSFLWPLTITSDPDLWVVQTGIASFQQQYASAQNYIMAASVVVAMPTMLLFFIFQRQLVESIKTSGFK
ncbi:MAG: carbohydrate ABC transporter permease [Chloroflexi bacterium]|nr:carbohydrate ABC transporter permease [Chloroflexota bacterium]